MKGYIIKYTYKREKYVNVNEYFECFTVSSRGDLRQTLVKSKACGFAAFRFNSRI